MESLANVYRARGEHERAMEHFEKVYQIHLQLYGRRHPQTARALKDVISCLVDQVRIEDAIERLDAELPPGEERARVLNARDSESGGFLRRVAWLETRRGNPSVALPLFDAAIEELAAKYRSDHQMVVGAIFERAWTHWSLSDRDRALEDILRALEAPRHRFENLLMALPEHERLSYADQTKRFVDFLLGLAAEMGDEVERTAYDWVLRWKGRVSRSLLATRAQLHGSVNEESRGLLDELAGVQAALSKAMFRDHPGGPAAQDRQLARLRKEREALERRLAGALGASPRPAIPGDDVGIDDLSRAMDEDMAVVDFFVYRPWGPREGGVGVAEDDHLIAFVVRGKGKSHLRIELGPVPPLEAAVREFLEDLVARRGVELAPESDRPAGTPPAGVRLRAMLWDPIEKALGGAKTVFVSPDRFLGTLPLEVLQRADGSYLLEHHAFVYLQDMTSLVGLAASSSSASDPSRIASVLSVGGVDYNRRASNRRNEGPAEAEASASPEGTTESDVRAFSDYWARLSATRAECEIVSELHEQVAEDGRRTMLQGSDATEDRVKAELVRHEVIHLATHGFFQPEGLPSMWEQVRGEDGPQMTMRKEAHLLTGMLPGLLSGIVLAGANRPPEGDEEDGLLTAEEISFLDLSGVDLVVLSACETGLGRPKAGEGMLGLRRTFRQAGARTVISSLWSVKDDATGDLMRRFYIRWWMKGETKLEALQGAKLDLLRQNRIEHDGRGLPSTWGAFVLDGAWD